MIVTVNFLPPWDYFFSIKLLLLSSKWPIMSKILSLRTWRLNLHLKDKISSWLTIFLLNLSNTKQLLNVLWVWWKVKSAKTSLFKKSSIVLLIILSSRWMEIKWKLVIMKSSVYNILISSWLLMLLLGYLNLLVSLKTGQLWKVLRKQELSNWNTLLLKLHKMSW